MPELTPDALLRLQQFGAIVLDTRPDTEFGAGHVPGSVNIPLSGQFASWAGALLGLETDLLLVAGNLDRATESRIRLARVGIERVAGYLAGGIEAWRRANQPLERLQHITVEDLDGLQRAGFRQVVNVTGGFDAWKAAGLPVAQVVIT